MSTITLAGLEEIATLKDNHKPKRRADARQEEGNWEMSRLSTERTDALRVAAAGRRGNLCDLGREAICPARRSRAKSRCPRPICCYWRHTAS